MSKDFQNAFHIHSSRMPPSLGRMIKDEVDAGRVNVSEMAHEVSNALKFYGTTTDVAWLDDVYCFGVEISNCFSDAPETRDEFLKSFAAYADGNTAPSVQMFEHAFRGKSFNTAFDATRMPN